MLHSKTTDLLFDRLEGFRFALSDPKWELVFLGDIAAVFKRRTL